MLLSLVVHTYSLRYWLPAAVMLGTAPAYLLSWSAWRLLSTMLPSRLYHTVDDCVYSVYQSMVLFFFENYTGCHGHQIHTAPHSWPNSQQCISFF
uniref:Uncharacterized protein n=1 Tax=Cyprinus carpio TaxID=7962 RepID=A0A8C1R2Z4_CYPCA